jgi:hypothetical protein
MMYFSSLTTHSSPFLLYACTAVCQQGFLCVQGLVSLLPTAPGRGGNVLVAKSHRLFPERYLKLYRAEVRPRLCGCVLLQYFASICVFSELCAWETHLQEFCSFIVLRGLLSVEGAVIFLQLPYSSFLKNDLFAAHR